MSEAVELVCSRLSNVHPKSGGGYTAKCPAHEDNHASLSIDAAENGRALLKCFAGCDNGVIVKVLGLTMADLFPRRNGGGEGTIILSKMARTLEHLAKTLAKPRRLTLFERIER
jgi:hypothetical protein